MTQGTSAAPAARNATRLTPIVFTFVADPVGLGLIASFARPGGTITGVSSFTLDLTGKRLELLKEAIPSLKSVTLLTNPANPASPSSIKEAYIAARQLGLDVRLVEIRDPAELETALASIAQKRATAVTLNTRLVPLSVPKSDSRARDKKPAPGAGLEQQLGRKRPDLVRSRCPRNSSARR